MRRILLLSLLLGGCAFDPSGQEMAEVGEPDAMTIVDDDPVPPPPEQADAGVPDAEPPSPDAEETPDWDDDHHGPGGGDGPGH